MSEKENVSEIKTSKNGRQYKVDFCEHCGKKYSTFLKKEKPVKVVIEKVIEKSAPEPKKRGRKRKNAVVAEDTQQLVEGVI